MELISKGNTKATFNPKVSIVIPVFNGSNYLREAIDSALAQTYRNIEIIVVNDGSDDEGKTEKMALSYGDKIRYFRKENGGTASALNFGIKQMMGEYFSWLSHDDQYYPEKVEVQINYLNDLENKSTILYSDFNYINENSLIISKSQINHVRSEQFRLALIGLIFINGCTLLIPKICFSVCGMFNETLKTTQDYDLWFRFSSEFHFVHLPQILVKFRLHPNQDTVRLKPIAKSEGNALLIQLLGSIRKEEIKGYYGRTIPNYYFDLSIKYSENEFYKAADFAFFLGLINFWRLKPGYIYEYFKKINIIIRKKASQMIIEAKVMFRNMKKEYEILSQKIVRLNKKRFLKIRFTKIYKYNSFTGEESVSGPGSDLIQTEKIRKEIPRVIEQYNIKVFIDAPCGDLCWIRYADFKTTKYIGIDIVDDIIMQNKKKYHESTKEFLCLDIVHDKLPEADIILVRDCWVHLDYSDIFKCIKNLKRSKIKYILTTTFTDVVSNADLDNIWRPLNLGKSPFNFPEPTELINEGCTEEEGKFKDKSLGLWKISDLADY